MALIQDYGIDLIELAEPMDPFCPILADYDMEQLWFQEEEVRNLLDEHDRRRSTDDENVTSCRIWLATLERLDLHAAAAHSAAMTSESAGNEALMGFGAHLLESNIMMDQTNALENTHFIPSRTEDLVDHHIEDYYVVDDDSLETDENISYRSSSFCNCETESYPTSYSLSIETPPSESVDHT